MLLQHVVDGLDGRLFRVEELDADERTLAPEFEERALMPTGGTFDKMLQ